MQAPVAAGLCGAVGPPDQPLGPPQAGDSDPFADGVEALDEPERRGLVPCVAYASCRVQLLQCAVSDRDGHDPSALQTAAGNPASLAIVAIGQVVPVVAGQRQPGIQAGGLWRCGAQLLQALPDEVRALDQGGTGQKAATQAVEFAFPAIAPHVGYPGTVTIACTLGCWHDNATGDAHASDQIGQGLEVTCLPVLLPFVRVDGEYQAQFEVDAAFLDDGSGTAVLVHGVAGQPE